MKLLQLILGAASPDRLTEKWLGTKDELVDIPEDQLAGYRAYDAANQDRYDGVRPPAMK